MHRFASVMLAVGLFAGAASAAAAPAEERPFRLGASVGVAAPFGKLQGDDPTLLSDFVRHQIPIALEAGYMVTPQLLLGVSAQYGFVSTQSIPSGLGHPHGRDFNLGVQLQYHPSAPGRFDPWLGLGMGYESLTLSADDEHDDLTLRLSGIELAKLQAGLNVRIGNVVSIGPFASYSIGTYLFQHLAGSGIARNENLDPALHEWLTFGLKGTVAL